jgi:putative membrane protein
MMNRLFRAPRPSRILLYMVLGSLLLGLLANGGAADLDALLLGTGAFALPLVISVLVTKPLAEALGGKMYLRRSALLGLMGMAPLFLASLASILLDPSSMARYLTIGWASTLWLRQIAILATSHSSPLRSFPAVINHPVLGMLALAFFLPLSLADWYLALLSFVAFYLAGLAFTEVSIRPLEKGFGVDGLSMLRYSLDHMTEKGREGREEMENFFESFSNTLTIPVGLLSVRLDGGRRAVMVVPSLHPGPYGNLGGSDLPTKLRARLGDLTAELLVPHGPSTHDQNPATSLECDRLADWIRGALKGLEYGTRVSRFVRVSNGDATVCCQVFDGKALLLASLAPKPTDDIDFATGFSARVVAKEAGVKDALLVDAHNCMELGSGAVYFGSREWYSILEATREAAMKALKSTAGQVRAGVASNVKLVDPERGLGPNGIQALVVEVDGQRTAYLLFDGNNMVPGLREKLLEAVEDIVDDAEVMTSDNHIVNNTLPGFNPVGWRMDHQALVTTARAVVQECVDNLSPAEIAVTTGWLKDVKVWGHQSAVRLTTAIHSSLSTMRINAAVTFAVAVLVSILGLVLIP